MAEGGKLKAENGAPEADECTEEGLPTNHTNAHEWGEVTPEQGGGSGGDRRDAVCLRPPTSDPHAPTSDLRPLTSGSPQVSFLIGHRGEERLPLLLTTLRSIAGQRGVSFECLVVEQDGEPRVRDRLPGWVRYFHTPSPDPAMPYCRSWALNVAARAAKGELLVCHDNDMLCPAEYGSELALRQRNGAEAMQLKRFVFYLAKDATACAFSSGRLPRRAHCERVVQNLEGGGSVGVRRTAFFAIGGLDEEFVGYGGEDLDFWDRCLERRVWEYAYLPLVHLWHAPQPGVRVVPGFVAATADLIARRRRITAAERIAELQQRPAGEASGPWTRS